MENKKFNLIFTEKEANIVLNSLSLQPFNQVAELITNIHQQASKQIAVPEKAMLSNDENKEVR